VVAGTKRAVEGSGGGIEAGGGWQQDERRGDGEHRDRRHFGHVVCAQASREAGDCFRWRNWPRTLAAQHIDDVVTIEAVETVQTGRSSV
jgi:hypothetical protein